MNRPMVLGILTASGAAFFLAFGLWPFLDAQSFYDEVADFEPYNPHFLHDIGAFQIGIGATLAAALWRRTDAIFAALAGAGAGASFHSIAHIRDHGMGGAGTDPYIQGLVAVLLLAGAAWKLAPERE